MTTNDLKFDFARFEHAYINKYITLADSKAGFAFAVSSTIIFYMLDRFSDFLYSSCSITSYFLFFGSLVLLAKSIIISVLVVTPRLSGSMSGVVFWSSVSRYPDRGSYKEKVLKMSDDDLAEETLMHCYDLARVCRKKYHFVRWAYIFGVSGIMIFVTLQILVTAGF